jgi:hypothetical protein
MTTLVEVDGSTSSMRSRVPNGGGESVRTKTPSGLTFSVRRAVFWLRETNVAATWTL